MNRFLTPLVISPIDDENYRLVEALIFESDRLKRQVLVHEGFVTDLASVPNALPLIHLLFAEVGKPAAVVHDFLLSEGKLRRETIDEVFYDALKVCEGVPGWKAKAMYTGVRIWTKLRGLFK